MPHSISASHADEQLPIIDFVPAINEMGIIKQASGAKFSERVKLLLEDLQIDAAKSGHFGTASIREVLEAERSHGLPVGLIELGEPLSRTR